MNPSSAILSAITIAGKLFGGYGTLTLGPARFTGLALPPSMSVGGEMQLTEHTLPGGAVSINAMGPSFVDKRWTGYFDGQTASQTARMVEKMWQSGGTFTLAWNVSSYQVIIKNFIYDDRLISPIKFEICCRVIKDNSATIGTTLTSMALQVAADLANGNPIAALSAVSQGIVGSSVTAASTASSASGATTLGSAAYNTAVSAVNTAAGAIGTAASQADRALVPLSLSLTSLSAIAPAGLATGSLAQSVTSALSAAGDIANLNVSGAYVERAAQNLLRVSA